MPTGPAPTSDQVAARPGVAPLLRPLRPGTPGRAALLRALVISGGLAAVWVLVNPPAVGQSWRRYPVAHLVAAVVLAALFLIGMRARRRGTWVVAGLVGTLMAAIRVAGAHYRLDRLRPFDDVTLWWAAEWLLSAALFIPACAAVLSWQRRSRTPATVWRRTRPGAGARWLGPLVVVGLVWAWTPYFLIYFPGVMTRDSWSSLYQGMGIYPMTNHHPVLFNLWLGACQSIAGWFGSGATVGIAIFSVVQLLVLAAGLAAVVVWMHRRFGPGAAAATLAYLALDPTVAIWSVTVHKDTLFALWMTLLTLLLAETSLRGLGWLARPRPLAGFAALEVAISFSRNNGPYIAAALCLAVTVLVVARWLRGRRSPAWRVVAVGALVVAATLYVQGTLYETWGVAPSSRAESAGLALHQVGWVATYENLTADEEEVLGHLMPVEKLREVYQPTIVDAVKFDPSFDRRWLQEHPREFQQLWRDLGREHPGAYAQAWYALSGGFLDPDRVLVRIDGGTDRGQGHWLDIANRDLLGPRFGGRAWPTQLPPRATAVVMAPGPNLAYSTGLLVWACVLACCAALLQRRPVGMAPYLPFLALIATLMIASPLTDFRYVGAGHLALPVLLAMMWAGPRARSRHRSRAAEVAAGV